YSGEELKESLRRGLTAGVADFLLNFPPGIIAGLLLGWRPLPAALLGGVTYISSSGVIARVLIDLRRLECPETPTILSVLVLEDLAMAVFLPLVRCCSSVGDRRKWPCRFPSPSLLCLWCCSSRRSAASHSAVW